MGIPATDLDSAPAQPRPPSLGAIASRDNIHFYLMTFARHNQIPLASEKKEGTARRYPEAGLWTTEQGFRALESEYKRINAFYQLARQTHGEGWVESNPDRTFTPAQQRARQIRFGLVTPPPPDKPNTPKSKKAAKTARKR